MSELDDHHAAMREALKEVGVALKKGEVPFALAGGYAAWARGAPEPAHDVDFLVSARDAEEASALLSRAGLHAVDSPEDWLFKVDVRDVVVDVIFRTRGCPTEEVLGRATEELVLSVRMPVVGATDVVTGKLLAMDEHYCDFAQVLPTMRSLREQVDWVTVRRDVAGHPFAEAMLFLLERLDILDPSRRPPR